MPYPTLPLPLPLPLQAEHLNVVGSHHNYAARVTEYVPRFDLIRAALCFVWVTFIGLASPECVCVCVYGGGGTTTTLHGP